MAACRGSKRTLCGCKPVWSRMNEQEEQIVDFVVRLQEIKTLFLLVLPFETAPLDLLGHSGSVLNRINPSVFTHSCTISSICVLLFYKPVIKTASTYGGRYANILTDSTGKQNRTGKSSSRCLNGARLFCSSDLTASLRKMHSC